MKACIERGMRTEGILPGGLKVKRRAPSLYLKLNVEVSNDPLRAMDWVDLFALAVNEENAAGGRVVTAPTNGAAGVPTITSGIGAPDKAVYAAMTSNPGGARSTVTCIDQAATPLRCYFSTWTIATNAAI